MIKKIIDVFETAKGEMPDAFRYVHGFSLAMNEWIVTHFSPSKQKWMQTDGNDWYELEDDVTIDFWTELPETFEGDI